MLAYQPDPRWSRAEYLSRLRFPLLGTPKIDGIRCLIVNGEAVTRTLKPIPNNYIRHLVRHLPEGFDGELVCPDGFHATQSAVMSELGTPPFKYRVFDFYSTAPYHERLSYLKMQHSFSLCAFSEAVLPDTINNMKELLAFEELADLQGYEGVMLRHPDGPYKFGRSTLREHYLLKLKRFLDGEATIVAFVELQHNENTNTTNALGLSERSTHQAGLVAGHTLGALRVRDTKTNAEFNVGSGFDSALRDTIWKSRNTYLGRVITYKYQPYGMKDAPRCPTFKCFV